ncbi:Flp pilus assembly protein TadD [Azospirillum sp. OGB3]|uniref:tetratricopeptide repeat protein n=1 Tax=Azospirillum sp. OGB3 TaxID=2587012 RepID=UPI0016068D48|nr:tetratricopeptide repeat protein [Azospirillum sp. OGB3]MBB3266964.1 Flp pilus assembly protein TadD [Azospirillum sp. OGB3]
MATIEEAYAVAIDHHQAGRLEEAAIIYQRILDVDPEQAHASHLLGIVAGQRGRPAEAVALIAAAVARDGSNTDFLGNLGAALKAAGRHDEAIRHFARALALEPAARGVPGNLGSALAADDRIGDAVSWLGRAAALDPSHFETLLNLGIALRDAGRFDAAETALETAKSLRPDHPHPVCELAVLKLALGDLEEGLALYERRWDYTGQSAAVSGKPVWRGEGIAGKTILLYYEQGLGDTLQFVRYAPLLADRGARVLLIVQPELRRLLASVRGIDRLATYDDADGLPGFDLCCPLMSLPFAFGTRIDAIPSGAPYITPPPDLVAGWAERLGWSRSGESTGSRPLRVGFVWSGNPRRHDPTSHAMDRRRSVPFALMEPLLSVPGIEAVSLQVGEAAEQARAAVAAGRLSDPMAGVTDFADTAAIAAHLDLVITVDTSVAHLAAAMGRPVWMLSRCDACWRWFRGRDDSPWYPTMRLYRQDSPGDWAPVMARVGHDLAAATARDQNCAEALSRKARPGW